MAKTKTIDRRRPLVVVIDDDESMLRSIARYFSNGRYDVLTAASGYIGLFLTGTHRPDAVLVDLMMPGIDGREVCSNIKGKRETKDIPVIAMTGFCSSDVEEVILRAGASALVFKGGESFLKNLDAQLVDLIPERKHLR